MVCFSIWLSGIWGFFLKVKSGGFAISGGTEGVDRDGCCPWHWRFPKTLCPWQGWIFPLGIKAAGIQWVQESESAPANPGTGQERDRNGTERGVKEPRVPLDNPGRAGHGLKALNYPSFSPLSLPVPWQPHWELCGQDTEPLVRGSAAPGGNLPLEF